jgi:hypothetical protein
MDKDRIRKAISTLAPVTYFVTVPGAVAVAISARALADAKPPEQVIADAIAAYVEAI